ncbi:efflux RND transporter periplasmic adaptor subunit [Shewanella sp. UCD-KL12]|uniref:efflux RND transporter periplasmic adaptor subunit n=1 Tax=Shewanella sp. UCD-KL12 TaxID=1917163 RepID=UPI0009707842|nr:efflux RND transporter periplasmic adaptor subunit [Shewanella sp. UCD-KL12]
MSTHKYSALLIAMLLSTACSQEQASEPKPSQPIAVMTINQTNLNHELRFTGILESQKQAQMAFRVAGTLNEILVEQGDRVESGQLLARLDPHDYQVRVAELEARRREAKASHQQAISELERSQFAQRGDAISQVSVDRAQTAVARAQAGIAVIEQNLIQAKDALRYTELKAPFSGVIGKKNFDNYEQVAPGLPVFIVHQPEALQAVIDIPERLLPLFHQGLKTSIYHNNNSLPLFGVVKEITSIPDPIKRTFSATIPLNKPDGTSYPGMVISARIADKQVNKRGLCLPASALYTLKNQPHISKISADGIERVQVEVIRQGRDNSCVVGDINLKDRIIVAGAAFVHEDSAIDNIIDAGVR